MRKLAMHVSRSDRIKRLFDGVEQPRKRSRLGASQSRCALRPTQLAGGESRRIGRQREGLCAPCRAVRCAATVWLRMTGGHHSAPPLRVACPGWLPGGG